jgi:hypothetical protein
VYSTSIKETILILIFAIVVVASGADLVADLSHGADTEHIVKEMIVVSISTIGLAWLLWGLRQQRLEIRSLQHVLESANSPQSPPKKYVLERSTQEKTVRQQASSIYKKAGVSGRHAFSAWFIEDIL